MKEHGKKQIKNGFNLKLQKVIITSGKIKTQPKRMNFVHHSSFLTQELKFKQKSNVKKYYNKQNQIITFYANN